MTITSLSIHLDRKQLKPSPEDSQISGSPADPAGKDSIEPSQRGFEAVPHEHIDHRFVGDSRSSLRVPMYPEPYADFLGEHAHLNDGLFRLGATPRNVG
jgi:hypothetical protein